MFGEIISRYFNDVLDVVIDMKDEFIKGPSFDTPWEIQCQRDWLSYFQVLR